MWVELHFADLGKLATAGVHFDCATCLPSVRRVRQCDEAIWDHPIGSVYPIKISPFSQGVSFCPAKLSRDDPDFVADIRHLFLAWRLGQVPFADQLDTMDSETADHLMTLISLWERMTRDEDAMRLARCFGATT